MNFVYRTAIFVSTVIVLSLKPLAANSVRTRNGVAVGQPIDRCMQSISEPGQYLLHIGRPWYLQECTLYIRSPFKTRVRLTFADLNLNCMTSSVKVVDGFTVVDSHKRKVYSLPDDASDQKRQLDLCRNEKNDQSTTKVVELSQNAGQISYKLGKSNTILVKVDFIPVEPTCNVILSGDLDGQYVLSNNGHAGDCRWYVTGAVVLTLDEMHLSNDDASSCAQANSNFAVRSSSIGWNKTEMTINKIACGNHNRKAQLLIPCKYTRLELHTSDDSLQWVKFRLRLAGDAEKEPGNYYCY